MANLGHEITRSTIAEILARYGIKPPRLERSRKTTWKDLQTRYWDLLVVADFFTLKLWTRRGLQRYILLFFTELSNREV